VLAGGAHAVPLLLSTTAQETDAFLDFITANTTAAEMRAHVDRRLATFSDARDDDAESLGQ
jgi:hypothetical protein